MQEWAIMSGAGTIVQRGFTEAEALAELQRIRKTAHATGFHIRNVTGWYGVKFPAAN